MVRLSILISGTKYWTINDDEYHRANGPAIYLSNGAIFWYWHDDEVTEFEHMMLVGQEMAND